MSEPDIPDPSEFDPEEADVSAVIKERADIADALASHGYADCVVYPFEELMAASEEGRQTLRERYEHVFAVMQGD